MIKDELYNPTAVCLPLNPNVKKSTLFVELTKAVTVNMICVGDVRST